jgi:hypothetical protein
VRCHRIAASHPHRGLLPVQGKFSNIFCAHSAILGKTAQNLPDAQFNVDKSSKKLFVRNQQRSHLLRSYRFGVHRAEPAYPDHLGKPARIFAIGLHGHCRQGRLHMTRFQQNSFKSGPASAPDAPLRQWPRLKSYPLHSKTKRSKKATRAAGSLEIFVSFTILPCASTTQTLDRSNDTSIPA